MDRRQELADAKQLLSTTRLLTLVGPGGVGKSRLAVRLGAKVRRAFPDGVWLVPFAGIDDEALVPVAVARALQLYDHGDLSPVQTLVERLAGRRMLLLLDNCEHVIESCAKLTDTLLRNLPGLRIVATSRHRLGVTGEHLLEVEPLRVPDLTAPPGPRDQFSALALFADRAAAVVPGFEITDENRPAVIRLCRRLDGLPLAIELAAVRMRVLGVEQLVDRLDDSYRLLTGGSRAVLPRHQTLRAAVDWSHALCTAQEQLIWARASVFAGGFALDAAETVCAGESVPRDEVLEAIAGLVDKSVLTSDREAEPPRYRMLDTIRHYGRERLREIPGAEEELRRRHRDWFLGFALRCEQEWFGPGQRGVVERLRAEQDNIRAALDFCLTIPGEQLAGLRLAGSLWFYWHGCAARIEGRYWLELALDANTGPTSERARGLWVAGLLANNVDDLSRGTELARESRALATEIGDAAEAAHADYVAGVMALFGDDLDGARALFEVAVDGPPVEGQLLSLWALDLVELAATLSFSGEPDRAIDVCERARRLCVEHGEEWVMSYVQRVLALAHTVKGAWATADLHAREALRLKHGLYDAVGAGLTLDLLMVIAANRDRFERAAVLLGAADEVWRDIDPHRFGSANYNTARLEQDARVRVALGEKGFERAYRRGRDRGLDAGVAHALEEQPRAGRARRPGPGAEMLTRRENEVAELIALGLSNQQIADRLVIARRTAEGHVERILTKLGFSSRSQVAAWIAGTRSDE